jgi:hypothetical protein
MQSSAAVAGRALIMLACVVGIPALALSGSSWSEMLKKLQDFRWPAILDLASASTSASLDEAPRFRASHAAASTPLCQIPASSAALPSQTAVVPAGYQTPAELTTPTPQPGANAIGENVAGAAPLSSDPFHSIPDRLRQLGATYYLLESWGSEQQMYRFYCKMAVGGNADYTRYFEAANSDPLRAMSEVLRQVETWRDGVGSRQ